MLFFSKRERVLATIIASGCLAFVLTGCGSKTEDKETAKPESASPKSTTDTVAPMKPSRPAMDTTK